MSQRLLISLKKNVTEDDDYFDGIYTEESGLEELLINWCSYDRVYGFYAGPWKITIRDRCFFDQFMDDFNKLKRYIPELRSLKDCWAVFEEDKQYWNEKICSEMGFIAGLVVKEINKKEGEIE